MLILEDLLKACAPGGASVLTSVTELRAAAGEHASVAPAKYSENKKSVHAFEQRFVDGKAVETVILDSKQSSINRGEEAVSTAIADGHPILSRVPRIEVDYGNGRVFSDWNLPHRAFDGHIRAGSIDGQPAVKDKRYQSVREATLHNAGALLNTSPVSAILGSWDSTAPSNQVRMRSVLVGEIIGVLANQDKPGKDQQSKRGGARVDPVAPSVKLEADAYKRLVDAQADELSSGNLEQNREAIARAKKGQIISAASLGLGAIPPSLESLGGVACRRIIRSWVLSFSTLRQLRFGTIAESNIAGRALLAALGLAIMARAEQELYLRANCDLVEATEPVVKLDERFGHFRSLPHFTVEAADNLLEHALNHAEKLGVVRWDGQILKVVGSPDVIGGASSEAEDEK